MEKVRTFLKKHSIYIPILLCLTLGLISLIFRNATLDDDLYLWESVIMKEALSRGEWIGHYGVGVHGFLFKLPVALIFFLTGPSLTVATIWNILIGCALLYVFYKILDKYFPHTFYPLAGSILLLTNFQFILHLPTYMREFPVMLSLLLFIYLIIYKKSYWLVGLALLLILDAKESVFFMILPGYLLYLLISSWKGFSFNSIKEIFKRSLPVLLPPVIYILLMIFTSMIPLNTVIFTVIPGVTKGGVEYQLKHFEMKAATQSIVRLKSPDAPTVYNYVPIAVDEEKKEEESPIKKLANIVVGYIGKFLYPRSFSFLSIPKIIFFPALFTSILIFKNAIKKKEDILIALILIMWSFIGVFVVRQSFDRYLFPITPIIFFLYLIFLKNIVKNKKKYIWIVVISSVISLVGLLFEADYVYIKLGLNIIATIGYILYYLLHKKIKISSLLLSLLMGALTFSVISFYFYKLGPLRQYINFGRDYEVEKVISYFDQGENILINDIGWDLLAGAYRGNREYSAEWKWKLRDWVPRKKHLREFEYGDTYTMYYDDIEVDREMTTIYGIEKIALTVSNIEDIPFPHQGKLEEYLNADWLELTDTIPLKNKTLYIFKVIR